MMNKGGLSGGGYVPAPEHHNPDPLVQLIGPANEGKVKIEGVEITALIDTGACMSAMTKFCRSFGIRSEIFKLHVRHRGDGRRKSSLSWVCGVQA